MSPDDSLLFSPEMSSLHSISSSSKRKLSYSDDSNHAKKANLVVGTCKESVPNVETNYLSPEQASKSHLPVKRLSLALVA